MVHLIFVEVFITLKMVPLIFVEVFVTLKMVHLIFVEVFITLRIIIEIKSLLKLKEIFQSSYFHACNKQPREAVVRKCSAKKVFIKILQNSQENTCARFSLLLSKKNLWHDYFPINFDKFLRTPFS